MQGAPPTFVPLDASRVEEFIGFVAAYYAFDSIPFDAETNRRGIQELISNPSYGRAWLIEHAGRAVGHVVLTFGFDLEFGGRQATVTELFIAEGSRSRGIGRRTLEFVESVLRAEGVRTLELQVERNNTKARALYERAGFVAHDRIPLSKRVLP